MRHWTTEERQRQAELIKQWQPWKKSTGAKTIEGKNKSKMNAYKHGRYDEKSKAEYQYFRALVWCLNQRYPKLKPV